MVQRLRARFNVPADLLLPPVKKRPPVARPSAPRRKAKRVTRVEHVGII